MKYYKAWACLPAWWVKALLKKIRQFPTGACSSCACFNEYLCAVLVSDTTLTYFCLLIMWLFLSTNSICLMFSSWIGSPFQWRNRNVSAFQWLNSTSYDDGLSREIVVGPRRIYSSHGNTTLYCYDGMFNENYFNIFCLIIMAMAHPLNFPA